MAKFYILGRYTDKGLGGMSCDSAVSHPSAKGRSNAMRTATSCDARHRLNRRGKRSAAS